MVGGYGVERFSTLFLPREGVGRKNHSSGKGISYLETRFWAGQRERWGFVHGAEAGLGRKGKERGARAGPGFHSLSQPLSLSLFLSYKVVVYARIYDNLIPPLPLLSSSPPLLFPRFPYAIHLIYLSAPRADPRSGSAPIPFPLRRGFWAPKGGFGTPGA